MNIQILFILLSFICLLLYSINELGHTIEESNQEKIKIFLDKTTQTTLSSFFTGIIVCLFTQSSSIITILTISLISCKILSLKKGIAIMIGSNIGTSFVSFFITLKIGNSYYLFFILSIVLLFCKKNRLSNIFVFLGLIFLSIDLIEINLLKLFNEDFLIESLLKFKKPLFGILSGIISSFLTQSSSTIIALTQNMYANNLIPPILGISIMLGANIGTTISGLLFSINTDIDSKRLVIASLLFNIFGVLLTIPFLYIYKERDSIINSKYLISSLHIIFNITTGIIGIIFIDFLVALSKKIAK